MASKTIPTLEEAKAYIDQIDFSQIIDRMVTREGWLKSDAIKVSQFYRNYLYLRKKYGKDYPLPPSKDIDAMWHQHILDTKKYRIDCDAIFGEFHDHYPYFGFDEKSDQSDLDEAFGEMQRLYQKEFNGEKIYRVRDTYSKIMVWIRSWIYGRAE